MSTKIDGFNVFVVTESYYRSYDMSSIIGAFATLDLALEFAEKECAKKCMRNGVQVYTNEYIRERLESDHECSFTPFSDMEDDMVITIFAIRVRAEVSERSASEIKEIKSHKEYEAYLKEVMRREDEFIQRQSELGLPSCLV